MWVIRQVISIPARHSYKELVTPTWHRNAWVGEHSQRLWEVKENSPDTDRLPVQVAVPICSCYHQLAPVASWVELLWEDFFHHRQSTAFSFHRINSHTLFFNTTHEHFVVRYGQCMAPQVYTDNNKHANMIGHQLIILSMINILSMVNKSEQVSPDGLGYRAALMIAKLAIWQKWVCE